MSPNDDASSRALLEALRSVLAQVAEPDVVLRAILEQAVERTGAQRGLLVEVDADGELAFRVLHGHQPGAREGPDNVFSRRLLARAVRSGEAIRLTSLLDDPDFHAAESIAAMDASAALVIPIRSGDRVTAVLQLEHRVPGAFRSEHEALALSLATVAGPLLGALREAREALRERERLRASERQYRGEAEASRAALASDWSFGRFVGRSDAVRELESTVRKAAATEFPVLVQGETGTGKSILARVLHYSGRRAGGPLVTVFCPSLERGLVEAELFGHRRGAFTGATTDRVGKVQAAEGGTLFLDEIGELAPEIQPKLLRLLQERTFERVGDARELTADVRVVAATNRDLDAEVRAGRFRQDLFERLNFLPVRVPPLRERSEDLPLLLRHCLDRTDAGRWVELSDDAARFLRELDFAWPGNVRHVEQLAARLAMEGRPGPFGAEDLRRLLALRDDRPDGARAGADFSGGLPALLADSERRWLEEALRRYPSLTRAQLASKLRVSESQLYKKLREHGITTPE
jgi:Nif-specific regulatory protein